MREGQAHRLCLTIIIRKHQCGHLICHRLQNPITLFAGEVARGHHLIHMDFDIDFAVGAIDSRGIVDEICIHKDTVRVGFHPTALGTSEIATFGNDATAQGTGVNANGIIGFITHIQMGF